MIEIRWHGRAGQGAKTASTLLAQAALADGKFVQAFPEYGPERSGAPMRAYTRIDERPIRRRYGIVSPDVVVVLDPSLVREADVASGLAPDGLILLNAPAAPDGLPALCVPADDLAVGKYVNVVMLGAVASALGVPLARVVEAARAKRIDPEPIERGYGAVEELCRAA